MEKLQEAAEKYCRYDDVCQGYSEDAFKAGAQWQQEHSKEVIEELVKALKENNRVLSNVPKTAMVELLMYKNDVIAQKHGNNEKQG